MKLDISTIIIFYLVFLYMVSFLEARKYHSHRIKTKTFKRTEVTRAYAKFLAKREARTDDDINDPVLVYSLALVSHKQEKSTCPYPLVEAPSNCPDYSCDLNEGVGGKYIYLCVGKKKLSEFGAEDQIVNSIKIRKNNKDCGNLKTLDKQVRNAYFGSDDIYICYGNEDGHTPLKDVRVFFRKNENEALDSKCKVELAKNKFLCLEKEPLAPRKIEFTDLQMITSDDNFQAVGNPEVLAEIDNDNGAGRGDNTIKRSLITTITKTSSWNIENKFGNKIETTFTSQTPIISSFSASITASFEMNFSKNKGEVKTDNDVTEFDFICTAPAGKYYKCRVSIAKYKANIPYQITRKVYLWDGKPPKVSQIKNYFYGVMSSAIKVDRCCYKNCDKTIEKVCDDYDANGGICPKDDSTTQVIDAQKSQTLTLDDRLNFKLIKDIKLVEGNADCPNGYDYVLCWGESSKCDFNNATFEKNRIYLCVKKTPLNNLNSQPINVIRVSKNSDDCGAINVIKTSLNSDDPYFLCFGNDPLAAKAPIGDIKLLVKSDINRELADMGYECDTTDIQVLKKYFLCYQRINNAPKKIQIKEFKLEYTKMQKQKVGPPKKTNEIIVSSTSASVLLETTKKTETKLKTIFDFSSSIGVGISGGALGTDIEMSATATVSGARTDEFEDSIEIKESTTFDCAAADNKVMKCVSSIIDYKVSIPYVAKMMYYDYEGHEMSNLSKDVSGILEVANSGSITNQSCCLSGCCTGEANEETTRPWCYNNKKLIGKDVLCSDLDKCFKASTEVDKKTKRRFKRIRRIK